MIGMAEAMTFYLTHYPGPGTSAGGAALPPAATPATAEAESTSAAAAAPTLSPAAALSPDLVAIGGEAQVGRGLEGLF